MKFWTLIFAIVCPPCFGATFNVRDYGAVCDAVTDDTAAINSAISAFNSAGAGVLYFPAGICQTTGSLTAISAGGIVQGEGTTRAATAPAFTGTLIESSSATGSLFIVTSDRLVFRDLALGNDASSAPTDGAGIAVIGSGNAGTRVDYEGIYVERFYNGIDVQVGSDWTMRSSFINGAVNYGIRIRNTVNGDAGDWSISDSAFYSPYYNGVAAIRIESSGGGKISNVKINANGSIDSHQWGRGIDVAPVVTTSILLVTNSSIENISGVGINIANTGTWGAIVINGNEFGLYGDASAALNIVGQKDLSVYGNVFRATSAPVAMIFNTCDNVRIANNIFRGYTSGLSAPGTTTLVNLNNLGHN